MVAGNVNTSGVTLAAHPTNTSSWAHVMRSELRGRDIIEKSDYLDEKNTGHAQRTYQPGFGSLITFIQAHA